MGNLDNYSFEVIRVTDRQVINGIKEVASDCNFTINQLHLNTAFGGGNIAGSPTNIEENEEAKLILDQNSNLVKSFAIHLNNGIRFRVSRLDNDTKDRISIITRNLHASKRKQAFHTLAALRKHFKPIDSEKVLKDNLNETVSKHYEIREAELSKLQELNTEILKNQEEFRKEKEKEVSNKKEKLETKFENRREELQEKFETKEEKLKEEQEKLDEKLKEIDNRESKHVRRQLRKDLKEIFQHRNEQFSLTDGTKNLRRPINIFSILLLSIFGIGTAIYGYLLINQILAGSVQTSILINLGAKQLGLALAFGSTAIFYIKWQNKWFEQHAKEEFKLKQYEVDLDRASWLVEMAFEWQEEKGTDIPEMLIDRLSKNLFTEVEEDEESLHPSEQLASAIFGASSEAKISLPGGNEVKFDRKGIKRLEKQD